jgi:hypothetical protein
MNLSNPLMQSRLHRMVSARDVGWVKESARTIRRTLVALRSFILDFPLQLTGQASQTTGMALCLCASKPPHRVTGAGAGSNGAGGQVRVRLSSTLAVSPLSVNTRAPQAGRRLRPNQGAVWSGPSHGAPLDATVGGIRLLAYPVGGPAEAVYLNDGGGRLRRFAEGSGGAMLHRAIHGWRPARPA